MSALFTRIFGVNWRTTISGVGSQIASALLAISLIPYTLPTDLANVLPPKLKANLFIGALAAKFILGFWNSLAQKDKTAAATDVTQK